MDGKRVQQHGWMDEEDMKQHDWKVFSYLRVLITLCSNLVFI